MHCTTGVPSNFNLYDRDWTRPLPADFKWDYPHLNAHIAYVDAHRKETAHVYLIPSEIKPPTVVIATIGTWAANVCCNFWYLGACVTRTRVMASES
jgi:hypothetical protein